MAILARIIQIILWLIVATWLGRKLFGWLFGGSGQPGSRPMPGPKPLYRDPWCGTHVSEEISYTLEHAGQVHHFCSAECRESFRRSPRHTASPDDRLGASA